MYIIEDIYNLIESWWYDLPKKEKHMGVSMNVEAQHECWRWLKKPLLRLDPQSAVGCKLLMITAKVAAFCEKKTQPFLSDPIELSATQSCEGH